MDIRYDCRLARWYAVWLNEDGCPRGASSQDLGDLLNLLTRPVAGILTDDYGRISDCPH